MQEWERALAYSPLLSPMLFILVAIIGSIAALRWRRVGFAVTIAALLMFYLSATPWVTDRLNAELGDHLTTNVGDLPQVGALVVLAGDVAWTRNSETRVRLGPISLSRVILAAHAYQRTHLPVMVSGGPVRDGGTSIAALMSEALERDFAVPVRWREERSETTYQNAEFSSAILKRAGIHAILLASQPRDLPRAVWSFRHFGIEVEPASEPGQVFTTGKISDFLPSPRALLGTFYAIHELLGLVYYRLAFG